MKSATKKVLIIEDSPHLAESLKDMLELQDIEAIIATSGEDGIEMAESNSPDLTLLDIRLPGIDGYEVFRQIKSSLWGKDLDVIILTASESIEAVAKNLGLQQTEVLFKPEWSMRELLTFVSNRLKL